MVVGVWWGENAKAGIFGEYLLALAHQPKGTDQPTRWVTFCKVGKGGGGCRGAGHLCPAAEKCNLITVQSGRPRSLVYTLGAAALQVGGGLTVGQRKQVHELLEDNVCQHPPACYE